MVKFLLKKTDEQWRAQLSSHQYEVTRHAATEPPFTGKYWNMTQAGAYHCVCCGKALFSSTNKFDAGCGWPSFTAPLKEQAIAQQNDTSLGMMRIEVLCRDCGAHLGHVFNDGPKPAGQRYCINSAALDFEPSVNNKEIIKNEDPV